MESMDLLVNIHAAVAVLGVHVQKNQGTAQESVLLESMETGAQISATEIVYMDVINNLLYVMDAFLDSLVTIVINHVDNNVHSVARLDAVHVRMVTMETSVKPSVQITVMMDAQKTVEFATSARLDTTVRNVICHAL